MSGPEQVIACIAECSKLNAKMLCMDAEVVFLVIRQLHDEARWWGEPTHKPRD